MGLVIIFKGIEEPLSLRYILDYSANKDKKYKYGKCIGFHLLI